MKSGHQSVTTKTPSGDLGGTSSKKVSTLSNLKSVGQVAVTQTGRGNTTTNRKGGVRKRSR